jgi:S-adenosylmethionine:tRNA ribosyltransferase-isomerase
LRAPDVLVVNDAATLPASLRTIGGDVEMRLMGRLGDDRTYRALLFGEGDFRMPTEHRPPPPEVPEGSVLSFASGLSARVVWVDPSAPRVCHVRFDRDGVALFRALYAEGAPIQYAHVSRPIPLWHVQSAFASRPWAFEAPSAGRPFTWELFRRLRERGVGVTWVTHAAGISSTGDGRLDDKLPLPERYLVGEHAVRAIADARARGGRVVAIGTTVTRALEAAALTHGRLIAGEGEATVVLGPGFRPRVVDGLFTGMHARGTSHFALLRAFAPEELLERAAAHAEYEGYLEHEFGDSCLLLADTLPA